MNIVFKLKREILLAIKDHFNLNDEQIQNVVINLNADQEDNFGDLSCNAALVLAKELKKLPREIADQISIILSDEKNKEVSSLIEKTEIAGPGFVNVFLKKGTWLKIIKELFSNKYDFYRLDETEEKLKYLIEFVSANPTGPLHLGHGRGGIIGDVLANILNFLGHKAEKEFYINDAGNQILKLGQSLKVRCQQEMGQKVELPEDGYAGLYLVDLAEKCVAEFGQDLLKKDDQFFADYAKEKLLELIKDNLNNYGIQFDSWFSEKSLHDSQAVQAVLDELKAKDLVYEKEGAWWFRSTQFGDDKDRVLKKSDGFFTYIAPDIAYHKNKFERGFDKLVDVLGQDHHGYVKRLKATMQALDYKAEDLDVILYQLVSIKEKDVKVRMSKRAGVFTTLQEVTDTVGKDVARFFYLNRKVDAHLEFDLATALKKTEENPVYYIQYAYVRTGSLLQKAKENEQLKDFVEQIENGQDLTEQIKNVLGLAEISVVRKIICLQEILKVIATSYHTHMLSYYAYELAHRFHNYYTNNRIIDVENIERSKARLFLTYLVRQAFCTCLDLLGLSKPEKM